MRIMTWSNRRANFGFDSALAVASTVQPSPYPPSSMYTALTIAHPFGLLPVQN